MDKNPTSEIDSVSQHAFGVAEAFFFKWNIPLTLASEYSLTKPKFLSLNIQNIYKCGIWSESFKVKHL